MDAVDVIVPNHYARLMERLNRMRATGRYCDVQFKVGDAVFPAHRVVLAAQADLLRRLFNINILEDYAEEIVMHNVDIHVLKQALDFIYLRQNFITKVPAA